MADRVRPKTNIIDRVQRDMQRQGFAARSAESRRWLLNMSKDLKPNATRLINNQAPGTKQVPQVSLV